MPKFNLPKKKKPHSKTTNNKENNIKIFNIVSCAVVGLSHILIIVALVLGFRYINIYPALIKSIIGIALCFVAMIDIVFFIGYKHKDLTMKIVSCALAFLILLTSSVGSYFLAKTNSAVSQVIGNTTSNESKYETISGVFVIRTSDADEITDISKLNKKIVGYVTESETGVATIGQAILDEANIDYAPIAYQTYDEIIIDISDGKIDAGIFLDGYRGLYSRNKEEGGSDYTGIIADFTDLKTFSKDVEVTANASKKDISKDPFNILLIGYSRTDIGSPVGLADAIIVASVNPKTYTVSMMSIARDSYVPISCYGGTKDKINSARGTSRACFIKTVEDYTGMDMDFYMEADYEAVVAVVDAIEGIPISNPVDFTLDGIFVPAGDYTAWGWQVLQFCRERHHMPNGDFDRQQHQKEVIIAIAEKLLKKADITLFLNAIDAAGDKFSTNLTLSQLTGMFNLILQTKNYTGMKVSKLIDFHQLRLTGYSDWYYNEAMSLPLWIYKVYQGSYDESIDHAKLVLGEKVNTGDQEYSFEFDTNAGYVRPLFYSLEYDEEQVHEVMPAYYPNFVGMSYDEAVQYCNSNGINVNWNFISSDESGYNEELDGFVVSQSLRYGIKVSAGTNTLTIMGDGNFKIKFPDYGDWSVDDAKKWCKDKGYDYSTKVIYTTEISDKDKVADMEQSDKSVIITYYSYVKCENGTLNSETGACLINGKKITIDSYVGEIKKESFSKESNGVKINFTISKDVTNDGSHTENEVASQSATGEVEVKTTDTTYSVTLHTYKAKSSNPKPDDSSQTSTCETCGGTGEVSCSTCSGSGKVTSSSSTCGTCGGTGEIPGSSSDCSTCEGTGKVIVDEQETDCSTCSGSGKVTSSSSTCETCGGDGEISGSSSDCSTCGGTGKIKCSACDGKGTIKKS